MIKIKNNTAEIKTYLGHELSTPEGEYSIPDIELANFSKDDPFIRDVLDQNVLVFDNNGIQAQDGITALSVIFDMLPKNVITYFENNDKDLKVCSAEALINPQTLEAEVIIPSMGRWIDEGYAFFTVGKPHRMTQIEGVTLTDIPAGILGPDMVPQGTVLKSYHDDEIPEEFHGYRVPASPDDMRRVGEVDLDTMAGYGWVPAGLGIKIKAKLGSGAVLGQNGLNEVYFCVNVKWGKQN